MVPRSLRIPTDTALLKIEIAMREADGGVQIEAIL